MGEVRGPVPALGSTHDGQKASVPLPHIQTKTLVHLKRKVLKEMEETILKGKVIRRARLPGATSTVKCPLISA